MRGGDIYRLKEVLGHGDLQTTMIYAHLRPVALRHQTTMIYAHLRPDALSNEMKKVFGNGRAPPSEDEITRLREGAFSLP